MKQKHMPQQPPDLLTVVMLLIVTLLSGAISILQRVSRGQMVSAVWVIGEFLAAILTGYLAFEVYIASPEIFPDWMTIHVVVAVSAHMGGRGLQGLEGAIYGRFSEFLPKRGKDKQ